MITKHGEGTCLFLKARTTSSLEKMKKNILSAESVKKQKISTKKHTVAANAEPDCSKLLQLVEPMLHPQL